MTTLQGDGAASTNNGAGFHAQNRSYINGQNQQCINCADFGFLSRNFSMISNTGANGSATIMSATFNCVTAYDASFMSAIRTNQPITNGQQAWKSTTSYSPALNTSGGNNSWINQV
jgi:hypothetical protein